MVGLLIKNFVKWILPRSLLRKIQTWRWGPELASQVKRYDLETYSIDDNVQIRVYWKTPINGIGKGPAMTLAVHGREVLRFDCFGPDTGHYHVNFGFSFGAKETRLFFREETIEQQIERALFELRKNARFYIERHLNHKVRRTKFDPVKLNNIVDSIQNKMILDIPKCYPSYQESFSRIELSNSKF